MSVPVFSHVFTLSGRRNRKSFFLYALFCLLLCAVMMGAMNPLALSFLGTNPIEWGLQAWLIMFGAFILVLTGGIVGAQRCRDFGWTGWAVLLAYLPFVGGMFWIAMFFIPGTHGPNRYGPDPITQVTSPPVPESTSDMGQIT